MPALRRVGQCHFVGSKSHRCCQRWSLVHSVKMLGFPNTGLCKPQRGTYKETEEERMAEGEQVIELWCYQHRSLSTVYKTLVLITPEIYKQFINL